MSEGGRGSKGNLQKVRVWKCETSWGSADNGRPGETCRGEGRKGNFVERTCKG